MTPAAPRKTFATLDGLRGLAALLVVYHHQHLAGINGAPPAAYLAVDLFFLMSGFVIAHAYEERLQSGLAPLAFMRLRLFRLYPLYLLGSAIGLAVAVAFWRLSAFHPATAPELLAVLAKGLVMAPVFSADPTVMAFPLNGPAWSLFFEAAINLVYAVIGVRLSNRALIAMCVATGAMLVWCGLGANDLNVGFRTLSFAWGLPRVAFSFLLGCSLVDCSGAGGSRRCAQVPCGRWRRGSRLCARLPADGWPVPSACW